MTDLPAISICVPTRGRPERFGKMARSALGLARGPVEIVAYLDDDDPAEYPSQPGIRYVVGPRIVQSDMWNRCWAAADGDIAMLCGDDVVFRTRHWDRIVARKFRRWPDRIGMVWPDDGSRRKEATLPFVTREWIEVAGTFTPPHFRSWFADRWIWEVAEMINRDCFAPGVLVEHRHVAFGKAAMDETYRDGERFRREDDAARLYESPAMLRERQEQAMRLCEYIEAKR